MNVEWAIGKLQQYINAVDQFNKNSYHDGVAHFQNIVVSLDPPIQAILREIDPDLAGFRVESEGFKASAQARRGLALLQAREELVANLGPTAPLVSTDRFHPVVWNAAGRLWDDGHFGQAVQRAATFLSAHVRDRLGRHDVQDVALMQQAFSNAVPEEGKPRLRWPGDPSNLTVKSMNDGLRQFAPAVFMTIRNPATHSIEDVPEHEALEQLATLSLLARWIDGCELVEAEVPVTSGAEIPGGSQVRS